MNWIDCQLHWQVLDAGSVWMKEFASALSRFVPTTVWIPKMSLTGHWQAGEHVEQIADPQLEARVFPLQRGYARFPLDRLLPFSNKLVQTLRSRAPNEERSILLCTTPFYAPVAERWRGPVVYYVTDLTKKYQGCNEQQVVALDKRLCAVASGVCPNSNRIAQYLMREAGCDREKITIIPNATRRMNVQPSWHRFPCSRPADITHLKSPVVGVIGNLAGNLDWVLLKNIISRTAFASWVFVGPTDMTIRDRTQSEARGWVKAHAHFTGSKPYGSLQAYARAFEVAALPYLKHEPTYSGSSTRFYEHLAAGRPMIGTRGFAELTEKEPLIELADSADDWFAALLRLKNQDFCDGYERARWQASQSATWDCRAQTMIGTLQRGAERATELTA
jgi:glycosyltransferase involved in cell wall biosynthesis